MERIQVEKVAGMAVLTAAAASRQRGASDVRAHGRVSLGPAVRPVVLARLLVGPAVDLPKRVRLVRLGAVANPLGQELVLKATVGVGRLALLARLLAPLLRKLLLPVELLL